MKSNIDWADILESGSETESEPCAVLDSTRQNNGVNNISHYGITINYPRTTKFLNLDSRGQQILYNKVWHNIVNTLGVPIDSKFTFEYCQSGQIHLHGYISINSKHYIYGAISDLAKAIHRQFPGTRKNYKEGALMPLFKRYRFPGLCIQYYDDYDSNADPKANFSHWKKYIEKEQ